VRAISWARRVFSEAIGRDRPPLIALSLASTNAALAGDTGPCGRWNRRRHGLVPSSSCMPRPARLDSSRSRCRGEQAGDGSAAGSGPRFFSNFSRLEADSSAHLLLQRAYFGQAPGHAPDVGRESPPAWIDGRGSAPAISGSFSTSGVTVRGKSRRRAPNAGDPQWENRAESQRRTAVDGQRHAGDEGSSRREQEADGGADFGFGCRAGAAAHVSSAVESICALHPDSCPCREGDPAGGDGVDADTAGRPIRPRRSLVRLPRRHARHPNGPCPALPFHSRRQCSRWRRRGSAWIAGRSRASIRKLPVRLLAITVSKPFLLIAVSGEGN